MPHAITLLLVLHFRVPTYLTGDSTALPWQQYDYCYYDFLNQRFLEFKHPINENSTKSRFLPASTSFHTKLLPAFMKHFAETKECPKTNGKNKSKKDHSISIILL